MPIPSGTDRPAPTVPDQPAPTRTRVHPEPPPARPARGSKAWLGVLAGALAAGLVTGGALAALLPVASSRGGVTEAAARRAVQHLGTISSAPQPVTVTFTLDDSSGVPGFSDRVTYRAVGSDAATVDLSSVGDRDVRLAGTNARVLIPAAQLGTAVLDTSRSGVVTDHRGLGTEILGTGIATSDLQSEAVTRLGDQAQADGVPASAQRVAAADVQAALTRLGITSVAFTYASR